LDCAAGRTSPRRQCQWLRRTGPCSSTANLHFFYFFKPLLRSKLWEEMLKVSPILTAIR
jgi:hypothetical protein